MEYELRFYLVDDKGNILYQFPNFPGNNRWSFYEVKAVSFNDVNKDGLKDIIIIADYTTGIGNEGAVPFPVASVYFQKDKGFINLAELDNEINEAKKNENVEMVLDYLKGREIKVSKQ